MDVKCFRKNRIVESVYLSATTEGEEEIKIQIGRKMKETIAPPDSSERYFLVRIRNFKTYERKSSNPLCDITWKYELSVRWSAHCLRDAYETIPSYFITLDMFASSDLDESLAKWAQDNLMGKMREMCFAVEFQSIPIPSEDVLEVDDVDDYDGCNNSDGEEGGLV
jgi:hypothetical protein